ncbi:TraR/DksA family transcriptional regulator [Streptomyces sp. NHF165]|uniref:TraR/DksA family transcriptional regulator n=1 Tax=Streptomyces sp. NHF165 TaxID=2175864 RepID=UPI001F422FFD|nr:hypothetical protein [Streptomyces sp. NHF165]
MEHQAITAVPVGLAPEDLGALRANLLGQRRFRLAQLRELEAAGPDGGDGPVGPGEEVTLPGRARLADSARMMLADVGAALARMDAGRYGSCHACAGPIDRAHLAVVPQARYCGGCRSARSTGRRARR